MAFSLGIFFDAFDFPGNSFYQKSFFRFRQLSFHKSLHEIFMKREKIVSLNECQIKRQSTKNATESTVSLGEKKIADLGPAQVWVRFRPELGQGWVDFGSGF